MPVINSIAALEEDMTAWRRDFHMHPELAYQEERTSQIVAEKLQSWGIKVKTGLGKTGVVGVIEGTGEGPSIGLRADMDALPIDEMNDIEWKSQNQGVMHACGHDGHTTMLLGAAKYLAETRNFAGTVHVIFQPAEEGFAGAKANAPSVRSYLIYSSSEVRSSARGPSAGTKAGIVSDSSS